MMAFDPHADEPVVELDPELWHKYQYARAASETWAREVGRYRALIEAQLGAATAGTVEGKKVVTYRTKDTWAEAAMRRENPDLAAHYVHLVEKEVFDMDLFARAFPDIADKYRTRSFNVVES